MIRAKSVATLFLTLLQFGCVTARVVGHATDPHPSFTYPGNVTRAELDGDDLYLAFEAVESPGAKRDVVVVRIGIPPIQWTLSERRIGCPT